MTEEKTNRQRRRNHINTVIVFLAIMIRSAVTGSVGYVVYAQSRPVLSVSPLEPEGRVQSGILTNQEGGQAKLDTIVREGMLAFTVNATPTMRDGKSEVDLMTENPSDNGNRFTMTIIGEDAGEKTYKSGYLNPKQYIENVPPDVELPTGEHRCIANLGAYWISDNAYIGRGGAQITLYVQN